MEGVGQAIGASMRETDITGWYRSASVLGVILTTLNGAGRQNTRECSRRKNAKRSIPSRARPSEAQHVWISCHIFPDDESAERWDKKAERTLDELRERGKARQSKRPEKDDGCFRQRHGICCCCPLSS